MRNDREESVEVREFRLEGATLVVAVAALLLAVGGAFYVGRRVERSLAPQGEARVAGEPLVEPAKSTQTTDVDRSSGLFDREASAERAEPSREARSSTGAGKVVEPPADRAPDPEPAETGAADGPYFVQIWAGRDREAAELLVGKLQRDGYPVRLFTDRVEGDSLYKVRVGGFTDESQARRTSEELDGKGYRGAWVTTAR